MPRAIFLDRDGVLNQAVLRAGISSPPANIEELRILPRVSDACALLKGAGFLLIVVTNQPDVSRGSARLESVEAINQHLRASLPVDDIRVCYHDDCDGCSCRKPSPGLLLQAAIDWKIDLAGSFMVGDRWKDIEAGKRAGCRTILVGEGARLPGNLCPDHRTKSLLEAAGWVIQQASVVQEGE
jgi:D-glycero-D-manno-heptose 1,7-bisphosphate phosphatase